MGKCKEGGKLASMGHFQGVIEAVWELCKILLIIVSNHYWIRTSPTPLKQWRLNPNFGISRFAIFWEGVLAICFGLCLLEQFQWRHCQKLPKTAKKGTLAKIGARTPKNALNKKSRSVGCIFIHLNDYPKSDILTLLICPAQNQ